LFYVIIPPLFLYFLLFCYPYILLHFKCFLLLVINTHVWNYDHEVVLIELPSWWPNVKCRLQTCGLTDSHWKWKLLWS